MASPTTMPSPTAPSALSNPTRRILAVVDFLTANPAESYGLTDLSRRLQLNKRTCHAILTTLAQAGYLTQDPATRAYRLGPSMLAAGTAAASRLPLLDRAKETMRSLGDELGLPSSLLVRGGDYYVFVDRHALPDPLAQAIHVGLRLPLLAPLGAFLMAWSSRDDFERWANWSGGKAARKRFERTIGAIRERGFEVALKTDAEASMLEELRDLHLSARATDPAELAVRFAKRFRDETYHLDEIDPDTEYSISCITAPLLGSTIHPEMALALGGPSRKMTGREIEEVGARLLDRTRRLNDPSAMDPA